MKHVMQLAAAAAVVRTEYKGSGVLYNKFTSFPGRMS